MLLRRVEDEGDLAAVVARAVREHISDPEYLAELAMWSGRHGSPAGVPARNTPSAEQQGRFPARVFANPVLDQPAGVEARDDAGVVLVLATATDDPPALLAAGRPPARCCSPPRRWAWPAARSPNRWNWPTPATRCAQTARRRRLPADAAAHRWAALNADPLPATPRRPLSEVAVRLDGSALQARD